MFEISKQDLTKAWKELYRDKPRDKRAKSRGIDNISIEQFKAREPEYLDEIYRQLEGGFFRFQKLKIYNIKRKGKKDRPIQAPTVTDRIVQKVLAKELSRRLTPAFKAVGIVGGIEKTTVKDTVKECLKFYKEGYKFILKTDVESYFPSIDKKRLKKIFWKFINDKTLRAFFNDYIKQTKLPGIPQGTPLSPFMANLFLLAVDREIAQERNCKHFRYIDDLIILCRKKEDAQKFCKSLEIRFAQIGLKIHPLNTPGKTMLGDFNDGKIDVLGVILKDGRLLIKPKKYRAFISEVVNPLKFKSHLDLKTKTSKKAIEDLLEWLNYKVAGWAGAYNFCDVREEFQKLDKLIYERFNELLKQLSLPQEVKDGYRVQLPKLTDSLKNKTKKP